MFLSVHLTDEKVLFQLIDNDIVTSKLEINEKHEFSEILWQKLPKYLSKDNTSTIEEIVVSYIPGEVRYSRLRTLFTFINTFGVMSGITLYEIHSRKPVNVRDKLKKKLKVIHPQYTS
jgi:hypothetical protein